MAMHPNLSMNFLKDSLSAYRRLVREVKVMRWDLLVAYCTLKRLTRVLKLSMDLGGSSPYQVNVAPLRDVGKTRHRITSSLVYRFAWVRKASRCSSGSVVPSYRSIFHPKGMSASIMRLTKGYQWVVYLVGRFIWERHKLSGVLTVRRGCDSSWVRSGNVWAESSSS